MKFILISKGCLRIGACAIVLLLVCWLYFRSSAAEASAKHFAVLYGVPSMLLSAVESWVTDEGISDDRFQVVNGDFLEVCLVSRICVLKEVQEAPQVYDKERV